MPAVKLEGGRTNLGGLVNINICSNIDLTDKNDMNAIENEL